MKATVWDGNDRLLMGTKGKIAQGTGYAVSIFIWGHKYGKDNTRETYRNSVLSIWLKVS